MKARERHPTAKVRSSSLQAIAALACAALVFVACRTKRPPLVYRLDSETRGWVVIVFNRPEAPPLPRHGDGFLVDVPKSGVLVTSTRSPVGSAHDTFLVRHPDGREVRLPWDAIRASHTGALTRGDTKPMEYESFFLGSQAEMAAAEKEDEALARVRATLP